MNRVTIHTRYFWRILGIFTRLYLLHIYLLTNQISQFSVGQREYDLKRFYNREINSEAFFSIQ